MSKTNHEQSTEGPAPGPVSSSLKRRTEDISVLVGGTERQFRLSSPTIAAQLELLNILAVGRSVALGYLQDHLDKPSPLQAMRAQHAIYLSQSEVVVGLLSEPLDGGAPLTLEEFWTLEAGEPDRVIETQERLSGIDSVRRNGSELLREARELVARRDGQLATTGEQL